MTLKSAQTKLKFWNFTLNAFDLIKYKMKKKNDFFEFVMKLHKHMFSLDFYKFQLISIFNQSRAKLHKITTPSVLSIVFLCSILPIL